MTDDSAAERSALKTLWPSSRLLLCSFHVLQKEWGWLHETKNMVLKEKRLPLMRMFQKVSSYLLISISHIFLLSFIYYNLNN